MRSLSRLPVLVALASLLVVLGAPAAQAHNQLVGSDPAAGSTVPVIPEMVTLTFNEPALFVGTELMVHTADDAMVNIGPPVLVDNTVGIAVTGELPAGEYTVIYRVTSADGHPIEGEFVFTAAEATSYGVATTAPTMTESPSASPSSSPSVTPTPSAAPSTATEPADEGRVSGAVLIAVAVALVLVGGVVGWLLLRRRPDGSTPGSSGP